MVGCCDDTNGYILLVGGEFALLSLPVNGEPSEFGVADTDDEELWLLWWWFVICEVNCELRNGWNCAYFGSIWSIINFDDDIAICHAFL